MARVVAIGEVMGELAIAPDGAVRLGYAGDTFNTAVYLARLGHEVSYLTALGADDPVTRGILKLMREEGLSEALAARAEGRAPGLYAIETDGRGERRFVYWRSEAPVRQLFDFADEAAATAALQAADLVYLSGITLAVLGEAGRARLMALLQRARAPVAFDPNYRPRLWPSAAVAREAVVAFTPLCRWVSVSEADAEALGVERFEAEEVVLRREDRSVEVLKAGGSERVAAGPEIVEVADTTGAGDSFNAAYLSKRLAGRSEREAVAAGQALARAVIRRPGAIIPRDAMPDLGA